MLAGDHTTFFKRASSIATVALRQSLFPNAGSKVNRESGILAILKQKAAMATYQRRLTQPPSDEREREIWIQHAVWLIFFEDSRNYAIEQLDDRLSVDARTAALKAIDDAVYGMMMIIDGVSGSLQNEKYRVALSVSVQLTDLEAGETLTEINLADGDGMCMAFHGWKDGDFGSHPPI